MQGRPASRLDISSYWNRLLINYEVLKEDLCYKLKENMTNILNWLDGKKTTIGLIIVFVASGLKGTNSISENVYSILMSVGGFVTTYGINSFVHKFLNK